MKMSTSVTYMLDMLDMFLSTEVPDVVVLENRLRDGGVEGQRVELGSYCMLQIVTVLLQYTLVFHC